MEQRGSRDGFGEGSVRRGIVFIVASPSGGGKTTICKRLLATDERLRFSISFTSRNPREGEREGVDYYFITKEQFQEKIENKEFLEWAIVHGNMYGTCRETTDKLLSRGYDVLMDIDVQGADGVKREMPSSVRIFILPPSKEVMMRRLRERGTDDEEQLERRIAIASTEIKRWSDYDYAVVNDDLEQAVERLRAIITAERLSLRNEQSGIDNILHSYGIDV